MYKSNKSEKDNFKLKKSEWSKKDYFFSELDPKIREKLIIDDVGEFSTCDQPMARLTSRVMEMIIGTNNFTITDATACCGGNSLSFSSFFKKVNSVEIDKERFNILKHNLENTLNTKNVDFYCGDYTKIYKEISEDVIFIDPPWGGPDYRKEKYIDCFLSNISLAKICINLSKIKEGELKFIFLKLPFNFDVDSFFDEFNSSYHCNWAIIDFYKRNKENSIKQKLIVLNYKHITYQQFQENLKSIPKGNDELFITSEYWSNDPVGWKLVNPNQKSEKKRSLDNSQKDDFYESFD
jgi:predicted RNA methylase